jgi:hypothetical protein
LFPPSASSTLSARWSPSTSQILSNDVGQPLRRQQIPELLLVVSSLWPILSADLTSCMLFTTSSRSSANPSSFFLLSLGRLSRSESGDRTGKQLGCSVAQREPHLCRISFHSHRPRLRHEIDETARRRDLKHRSWCSCVKWWFAGSGRLVGNLRYLETHPRSGCQGIAF